MGGEGAENVYACVWSDTELYVICYVFSVQIENVVILFYCYLLQVVKLLVAGLNVDSEQQAGFLYSFSSHVYSEK